MSTDFTQDQSSADAERSKTLSMQRSRPPTDVPGYTAQRFLGAGAYGEVWVGRNQTTGRQVAIKFYLHRAGLDWSLLSREVEKLVFLSADRYVVQLLDVGWTASPPYYVMEYVESGSLDERLRRDGTLSVAQAVEIFRGIAIGLSHAHGRGVLHCDVKPANILLDQDGHPRLADFGQSRLSSEQKPALGTLFYMAPEQADLEAMPDVRWDVYALGAILYCMLVGNPPYRTEVTVSQIETAGDLREKLSCYRTTIQTATPPKEHREVSGVDQRLADIIDRCLAPDPQNRFANIQEVLDALDTREAARARLPLMIAGLLLPVLVLLVTALFSWQGYLRAERDTEEGYREWAQQSNSFAAKWAAERVTSEIAQYFQLAIQESNQSALRDPLAEVLADASLAELNATPPKESNKAHQAARESFVQNEKRVNLEDYLEGRLAAYGQAAKANPHAPKFASIFLTDSHGTQLAAAFDDSVDPRSIGNNLAHRVYFQGGPVDQPEYAAVPTSPRHVEHVHFSAVFRSTSTQKWKVAVSVPLYASDAAKGNSFIGMLVMTINLGDFEFIRHGNRRATGEGPHNDQLVVLVDGRDGESSGNILQHPLFSEILEKQPKLPEEFHKIVIDRKWLTENSAEIYHDPLGSHELGKAYRGDWLAATAPVREPHLSQKEANSGLVVLVQSDYRAVVAPVQALSNRFSRNLVWMLVVVIAVSSTVWYAVIKLDVSPLGKRRPLANSGNSSGTPSSQAPSRHDQTTLFLGRPRQ